MSFDSYELSFSDHLPVSMIHQLESLLFFNAGQHHLRREIEATIERYGLPEIKQDHGGLSIELKDSPNAKTLFAVQCSDGRHRPVGFVVYVHDQFQRLNVLHVGVAPDHVSGAIYGKQRVLSRLLNQIRTNEISPKSSLSLSIAYRGSSRRAAS